MKTYISIVLLVSFVNLSLATDDTIVENKNGDDEVTHVEREKTAGTCQINPLKRVSYLNADVVLHNRVDWFGYETDEDTLKTLVEEEEEKAGGCFFATPGGAVILILALSVVLGFLMGKWLDDAWVG